MAAYKAKHFADKQVSSSAADRIRKIKGGGLLDNDNEVDARMELERMSKGGCVSSAIQACHAQCLQSVPRHSASMHSAISTLMEHCRCSEIS